MHSVNLDTEVKCRTTKDKVREMKANFQILKMERGVLLVDKLVGGLHYVLSLVLASLRDPTPLSVDRSCDMSLTNSKW